MWFILSMMLILLILFVLMVLNIIIMKKNYIDREKITPFECGFDPISDSRLPFSIHFFLIALMFLIFDVEIVLMLPMIFSLVIYTSILIISFVIFILILILGIILEWMEGSLNWMI